MSWKFSIVGSDEITLEQRFESEIEKDFDEVSIVPLVNRAGFAGGSNS